MTPSQDTYRELFERSADAILIIEGDTFVECNQATVDMLRYRTREELLQTHPSELSPPIQPDGRDSFEKANEMIRIAFERGSHRFEWDHQRADGEVFPVEVLLTAVRGDSGRRLHVVWRDITDRKRLEADLRHTQKLEAVGQLAGGIAHDFNNLLVPILGHAGVLEKFLSDRPDLLEHVEVVRLAGERAADLVARLLAFSRKQELRPRSVEINGLLRETMKLLSRVISEDIEVELDAADEDLFVKADPGQLEQIVLNLASNARHAMPKGGAYTLRTRAAELYGPADRRGSVLPAGRYARLVFTDTGTGIPADLRERIFEPFFTTKDQGQGTGLGLSTAYGIIRQSGGDITVESEPGRGATFTILLPITDERPQDDLSVKPEAGTGTVGGETILLVEDETLVAEFVETLLTSKGYTVLRAENGEQGLALAGEGEFDLLLTDVVMPRMGGFELARILRAERSDLPVLFMSGDTDGPACEDSDAEGEQELISKPFVPEDLLRRIRKALDRSAR